MAIFIQAGTTVSMAGTILHIITHMYTLLIYLGYGNKEVNMINAKTTCPNDYITEMMIHS